MTIESILHVPGFTSKGIYLCCSACFIICGARQKYLDRLYPALIYVILEEGLVARLG